MSGILDKKKRILDFVITDEGRNQAANGELRIHYASFSDASVVYTEKSGSLADDISDRIYFEVNSKPQDSIVLENPPVFYLQTTGQEPALKPFQTSLFKIAGTNVQLATPDSSSSVGTNLLTGSQIPDHAESICTSLSQNFKDMQIIGTKDPFSDTTGFEIGPLSGSFTINNNLKYAGYGDGSSAGGISTSDIESIFQSNRFDRLPNFRYMPPINKPGSSSISRLGNYDNLSQFPKGDFESIITRLETQAPYTERKKGLDVPQPPIVFEFTETSRENNVLIQPIEFTNNGIKKLAVIDYGEFADKDTDSPGKHMFFVGKIYIDENGHSTYVNIFTVVMD